MPEIFMWFHAQFFAVLGPTFLSMITFYLVFLSCFCGLSSFECQVTAKEANMTPVNTIAHPINFDGSLLFPLYHHLNPVQAQNNAH